MSDLQIASQELRALFGDAAATFTLDVALTKDDPPLLTPIGLKVHDAHGQRLTPTFTALQDAELPLLGEDEGGEAVLEAAHHTIAFGLEAAYLEAVADPDVLDDLMSQIVYQDAVFDLSQALNALARRPGEETFTLEPAVTPVNDAVR